MMTAYTYQEFIREVLGIAPVPTSSTELWAFAEQKGLASKLADAIVKELVA